jgi:hypothetical protein
MIICADDFGLTEDINRAIIELCAMGRLSAVSCMTALPQCTSEAMLELLQHEANVDVGLHLYLADKNSPTPCGDGAQARLEVPTFNKFLRRALLGRIRAEVIATQVSAQYQCFVEKTGRLPDFIDGHLYVHQFPGVREGLIQFALSLPESSRPYFRNTRLELRELKNRRLPWFKALLMGRFGAVTFKQLSVAGLATNRGFAGIYDFHRWHRFPEYLPQFLDCLLHVNGLLVTHPGGKDQWRLQEFETLRRFSFPEGRPNRFLKGLAVAAWSIA